MSFSISKDIIQSGIMMADCPIRQRLLKGSFILCAKVYQILLDLNRRNLLKIGTAEIVCNDLCDILIKGNCVWPTVSIPDL